MSFLHMIHRIYEKKEQLNTKIKQNQQIKTKRPSPMQPPGRKSLARDSFPLPGKIKTIKSNMKNKLWKVKRASLFPSGLNGSMTIEAALILPLLLFFFLNLFSGLEMLRLHGKIQMAIWETGRRMSVYGYAYDLALEEEQRSQIVTKLGGVLFSQTVVKDQVVQYLGTTYLEGAPLAYGAAGLNFAEPRYMQNNDILDILVTYEVTPWIDIAGFRHFRMGNRYYCHAWTGYEIDAGNQEEETQDYVYVTKYGEVYHETIKCSYLKRVIVTVPFSEAQTKQNGFGEYYTSCELCERKCHEGNVWLTMDKVYLTAEGRRYHYTTDCPALKRTINTILRTEAQKRYEPCSRCCKNDA